MKITVEYSVIGRTRWYEFASRFLLGGAVTALAGIIAQHYGPGIGGLFLAFPAILPATATLIESHEKKRKRKAGVHGTVRGRKAAALDAFGASVGAFGLLAFALVVWKLLPTTSFWIVLLSAMLGWLAVSILGWKLWHR